MRKAAVMLVVKDGLILGVSRINDSTKWGLAGGKVEEGESTQEAAIRETFEETGIRVNACSFLFERIEPSKTIDGVSFNTYCFYADDWSGEIFPSEEGDVKWLTPGKLMKLESGAFPEYNLIAINILRKLYPSIYLNRDEKFMSDY